MWPTAQVSWGGRSRPLMALNNKGDGANINETFFIDRHLRPTTVFHQHTIAIKCSSSTWHRITCLMMMVCGSAGWARLLLLKKQTFLPFTFLLNEASTTWSTNENSECNNKCREMISTARMGLDWFSLGSNENAWRESQLIDKAG